MKNSLRGLSTWMVTKKAYILIGIMYIIAPATYKMTSGVSFGTWHDPDGDWNTIFVTELLCLFIIGCLFIAYGLLKRESIRKFLPGETPDQYYKRAEGPFPKIRLPGIKFGIPERSSVLILIATALICVSAFLYYNSRPKYTVIRDGMYIENSTGKIFNAMEEFAKQRKGN